MSLSGINWALRRWVWDRFTRFKFKRNKPVKIPLPPMELRPIRRVPFEQVYPAISISKVMVPDHIPPDEDSRISHLFIKFQMWLNSVFGPSVKGLPPIDDDPKIALQEAYGKAKQKLFPAPGIPDAYSGDSPDLGRMAVEGPYAGYLRRVEAGRWEWDLRELGEFEHWPDLRSIGCRVEFELDVEKGSLHARRIECELGEIDPQHAQWKLATGIAMCAITTHASLVRHFLWVHLEIGAGVAISTRNLLPGNHPLCRLLWPHIYRSQYSNDIALQPQMMPKGDFVMMYSLTHKGMCELFDRNHSRLDVGVFDPVRDAEARGVVGQGFSTPSNDNLTDIFEVLLDHTTAYVNAYYGSDDELATDTAVRDWVADLDANIPNGISVKPEAITRDGVARWIAIVIYAVSVEHELRGTFQWNYQLWTHQQPSRVYQNARREPVDVYQRLVNANMTLNVHRTEMGDDFSYLGLDDKGAKLIRNFHGKLRELQDSMNDQPRQLWRLYPDMLNANMNA